MNYKTQNNLDLTSGITCSELIELIKIKIEFDKIFK